MAYRRRIIFVLQRRRPQGYELPQEAEPTHFQDQKRGASRNNLAQPQQEPCGWTIQYCDHNQVPLFQPNLPVILQFLCLQVLKKTLALLDLGASPCFLNKKFAKRYKIRLVYKSKPIHIEVINRRPLPSDSIIHKSEPIEVEFQDHSSYIVFNIITTPSNLVIFGLFGQKNITYL